MILLIAVVAAAVIVQTAPAAAEAFKIKKEGTLEIKGKQHGSPGVWTFDTGSLSCNEETYTSAATGGTEVTEVSVAPTYSECIAFGFFNVPIDVNGCIYRYTVVTKISQQYEGAKDIICPAGQVIKITAPGCTVTVGSQNALGTVTFTNIGSGSTRELTIDENMTNIAYEEHRPLFGICANNTVPKTNGTYVGSKLWTGVNDGLHRGIWVG